MPLIKCVGPTVFTLPNIHTKVRVIGELVNRSWNLSQEWKSCDIGQRSESVYAKHVVAQMDSSRLREIDILANILNESSMEATFSKEILEFSYLRILQLRA